MTIQKRINFAYLVYLFVMGIQIFDVFVLRSQESDFSINIISRVVGIIISLVVSAVMGYGESGSIQEAVYDGINTFLASTLSINGIIGLSNVDGYDTEANII